MVILVLASSLLVLIAGPLEALAHAPLDEGRNDSLATATHVPDASKSYVLYDEIDAPTALHYYEFARLTGERIYFTLFLSPAPEFREVELGFALMGPGLPNASLEDAPAALETPEAESTGIQVFHPNQSATPSYEGFTPSATFDVARVDLTAPAPGEYYLVVFPRGGPVNYGLAIGYVESFTLGEWLSIPLMVTGTYLWEGQPLALVLLPFLLATALSLLVVWHRSRAGRGSPRDLSAGPVTGPGPATATDKATDTATGTAPGTSPRWYPALVRTSAVLVGATSATTITQLFLKLAITGWRVEALVTVVFALLPLGIALGLARQVRGDARAHEGKKHHAGKRWKVGLFGVLGLFAWAGYFVGPALAIVAAVLPSLLAAGTKREFA